MQTLFESQRNSLFITAAAAGMLLAAGIATAAPPQITGLTAAQREGTKLVDLAYNG